MNPPQSWGDGPRTSHRNNGSYSNLVPSSFSSRHEAGGGGGGGGSDGFCDGSSGDDYDGNGGDRSRQQHLGDVYSMMPGLNFTRTCDEYKMVEKIGEGTYGQVYRGYNRETNEVVAMKKMRVHSDKEGYPITAIREIKILKKLQHEHMVRLHEVVTSKGARKAFDPDDPDDDDDSGHGDLFLVLEYVDHDLTGLIDEKYHFKPYEIKSIMKQLFEALKYMHGQKFIHRDLKCSNLLLSQNMKLKLAVSR